MVGRGIGLRARFVLACGVLVLTSALAGVWTLSALARLSSVVGQTVEGLDVVAASTSQLADALEREDDALLLALGGNFHGHGSLESKRALVDAAADTLLGVRGVLPLPPAAAGLRESIASYRQQAEKLVEDRRGADRLLRYHRDAHPLFLRAVAHITAIREQFFQEAQRAHDLAKGEVERSRGIVLLISCAAVVVSTLTALHLVRAVVGPLHRITRGVRAIKDEQFDERLPMEFRDELGDLAIAFNEMAARLADFRRTNIGEVLHAKETLEATLQALPDAVVLIDHDGVVVSLNAAAENLLVTADKRPRRAEDIIIEGFDPEVVLRFLARTTPEDATVDLARSLRIHRNGRAIRLLPRLLPVPGLEKGRSGAILVLYDVTELAQLDERRADLVAVASHELQTPLTTLHMTLLMLNESSGSLSSRQTQLVDTAMVGAEQLTETVSEYLDLTRIEAGQLRLSWDRVDVVALATHAVRRAQAASGALGARIVLTTEEDIPLIWGDASRLRLVLNNLLSNAVKYTPAGRIIEVWLRGERTRDAGGVHISVQDDGPGVPPQFRTKIFEKFFRVEHQRLEGDRGLRGSGIGLHIARQIVEHHGGRIECTSSQELRGARMIIDLPADGRVATRSAPAEREYAASRAPVTSSSPESMA
jgi:NtrC-family two-component system sensor histidine kinase KinB